MAMGRMMMMMMKGGWNVYRRCSMVVYLEIAVKNVRLPKQSKCSMLYRIQLLGRLYFEIV